MRVNNKSFTLEALRRLRKSLRRLDRLTRTGSASNNDRRKRSILLKRIEKLVQMLNTGCLRKLAAAAAGAATLIAGVNLQAQAPKITAVTPATNSIVSAPSESIRIRFSEVMDTGTLTTGTTSLNANITVIGSQRSYDGRLAVSYSNGNRHAIVNPNIDFYPGEPITVTVKNAEDAGGTAITRPLTYQFTAAPLAGTGTFTTLGAGSPTHNTVAAALGDMDGDGDMDIVMANSNAQNRVLRQIAELFYNPDDFGAVSDASRDVALADVDDDGDLDIFEVLDNAGSKLWLNNGNASFVSVQVSTQATDSRVVETGDFNGDGVADFIVGNENNDADELFLGNGDGTFVRTTLGANTQTNGMWVGDLENDGDLDVLTATRGMYNKRYTNNGDGTFVVSDYGAASGSDDYALLADFNGDGVLEEYSGAGSVAVGDVNYDCILDKVIVQNGDHVLYLGNGDGTFTTSVLSTGNAQDVVIGDLDGDGDLDAFIVNNGFNIIWENTGVPTIAKLSPAANSSAANGDPIEVFYSQIILRSSLNPLNNTIQVFGSAGRLTASSVAHGSGDHSIRFTPADDFLAGEKIMVTVQEKGESADGDMFDSPTVYRFTGAASGGSGNFDVTGLGNETSDVALADFDGDGDLDGFTIGADGRGSDILRNDGSGNFTVETKEFSFGECTEAGDFDGDYDMDAIIGKNGVHVIWFNNGDASFTQTDLNGADYDTRDFGIGDFDADGDMDILVANFGANQEILVNNGDGTFASSEAVNRRNRGVAVGDLDGDGDLDAIFATEGSNANGPISQQVWLNSGFPSFVKSTTDNTQVVDVDLGDLDGDGDLDAFLVGTNGQNNRLWLNNGDGTFVVSELTGGNGRSVEIMDVDGDDDFDVVLIKTRGKDVYYNNGDATFYRISDSENRHVRGAHGDIDNDGDVDLLVAAVQTGPYVWKNGSAQPKITGLEPSTNANAATIGTVSLKFNHPIAATTSTLSYPDGYGQFTLQGMQGGLTTHSSISSVDVFRTIDFNMGRNAYPNERILFSVSEDVQSHGNLPIDHAHVYEFRAEVQSGSGVLVDRNFGSGETRDIALGDLNGDGLIDAIAANTGGNSQIWLNQGGGDFSTTDFGGNNHYAVALGDLDGDGDLDAMLANMSSGGGAAAAEMWLNNGDGTFTISWFGGTDGDDVALYDMDGDGDLDAVLARNDDLVLALNDGSAGFATSVLASGSDLVAVAIGDLNNDGLPDIVGAQESAASLILRNDGGTFTSQALGAPEAWDTAIMDVDGDGIMDILFATNTRGDLQTDQDNFPSLDTWRNIGEFSYNKSSLELTGEPHGIATGDVDNDGDIDVFIATEHSDVQGQSNDQLVFNNGVALNSLSTYGSGTSRAAAMADIDDDGSVDVVVARSGAERIWQNLDQPSISVLTPSTVAATSGTVQVEVGGWDVYPNSSHILPAGITTGSVNVQVNSQGRTRSTVTVPAGELSVVGGYDLYIVTPGGETNALLTVINDKPIIATRQTVIASPENAQFTLTVKLTDVDPGIAGLTLTPPTADGTLLQSIAQLGSTAEFTKYVITPVVDANGSTTLTFSVDDGALSSSTTFSVSIVSVNGAPEFTTGANVTVNEDSGVYDAAFATGIDDGDPETTQTLTFDVQNDNNSLFSVQPQISVTTGNLTFVPATNQNGQAIVSVKLQDNGPTGGLNTSSSATQQFVIDVLPVNDAPVISTSNSVVTTEEDIPLTMSVDVADIDTPFNNLILTVTSANQSIVDDGSIVVVTPTSANTTIQLTPETNANGLVVLYVSVNDGEYTRTTSFSVDVQPINDTPLFNTSANITVNEDSGVYDAAFATGIDDGDPETTQTLTFDVQNDNNSLFSVQPQISVTTGNLTFVPATNQNGQAIVSVKLQDNGPTGGLNTSSSATQQFVIDVLPVNDAPVISTGNAVVNTLEDTPLTLSVNLEDIDTAFNSLILSATSSNQSLVADGDLTIVTPTSANTRIVLNPGANANGSVDVTVSVFDGEYTRVTTFVVNILPVNDAPVISTNNAAITIDEDMPALLSFNLSDIDTPFAHLSLNAVSNNETLIPSASIGFGTTSATTSLMFTPQADANGSAVITVTAGDGEYSRSTSFNITVDPVNDAPTISGPANLSSSQNQLVTTAVQINDIDNTFSQLTVSATSSNQALFADADLVAGTTAATVQLNMSPQCGTFGNALITVRVSDGEFENSTSFNIVVQPIAAISITGANCGCPNVQLTYEALPSDNTATHVWNVEGGSIIGGQGTGTIQVVWDQNASSASLSLVRTASAGCTTGTALIVTPKTVQALMDHVLVTASSVVADVLNNDVGTGLSILSVRQPAHGQAQIINGKIEYTPDSGFNGIDVFNYVVGSIDNCVATGALVAVSPLMAAAQVNASFVEYRQDHVGDVRGLGGAYCATVSPDGEFLYVAGRNDHSIALFQRNTATGELTWMMRVRNLRNGVVGLEYPSDLAIDPAGEYLYAACYGDNALLVFKRDAASGELTFVERKKKGQDDNGITINGMKGPRGVVVSADGRGVLVSGYSDNSIAVFNRVDATEELHFVGYFKDGLDGVNGLRQAIGLDVSLDGRHVYVAGTGDNAVALFERSLSDGVLTYSTMYKDGVGGVNGLSKAIDVAVSPDGKHVYVAGNADDAVALFDRNSADGTLSFVESYDNGNGGIDGLDGITGVAVSPDGAQVWAGARDSDALVLFKRDRDSGKLTFVEVCRDGVDGINGLAGAIMPATSWNGEHIYVPGYDENAVAVLYRNHVPTAADDNAGAATANGTLQITPLNNDGDSDGHTLTVNSATDGSLGTVAIIGGGTTLEYSAGATTGADQFTYTISDGYGGESTATVTLSVVQPKQSHAPGLSAVQSPQVHVHPNPLRSGEEVLIAIDVESDVVCTIHDLAGHRIATFTQPASNSGVHEIRWTAEDGGGAPLAAGAYILLVEYRGDDGQRHTLESRLLIRR